MSAETLDSFIKLNRDDMLIEMTAIVADLKETIASDPAEYTERGCDEPSIDVRLCVDLDPDRYGVSPGWIIRTGLADYDQYHSEYCACGSVGLDTDPAELLNELIEQLFN